MNTELEQIQADEKARLDRESAAEQARADKERRARDDAMNAAAMKGPTPSQPPYTKPVAKSEPDPKNDSAARLRAFEDENFGKRAVRINGVIERGVGSPYAAMTDERRAQYAALEDIVAAEQQLNDATNAVAVAEAARVAAEERLANCDKLAQEKAAAVEAEKAEDDNVAAQDKSETEKTHKDKAHAAGV